MCPVDVWAAGESAVAGLRTRCALSKGTLSQMQAQSSRLGKKESRPSRRMTFRRATANNATTRSRRKLVAVLFLPYNRGIFQAGLLVPPVETREVTCIPCLSESRSTQIPVWADFTRHGAQIVPEIND